MHSKAMTSSCTCPDCASAPFTRNYYFDGKLLVKRDFDDEQAYYINKLRHHNRYLHGCGVVCGLRVTAHEDENCQRRYVWIEPGTAIDCCGREIVVAERELVDLYQFRAIREMQPQDDDDETQDERNLQICIRYRECPTEEIPILFDDCGCSDDQCAPNRILESFEVDVILLDGDLPTRNEVDCDNLIEDRMFNCADCECEDCLVLASIKDYAARDRIIDEPVEGATVDFPAAVIDNSTRRMLPSVQTLLHMLECLTPNTSPDLNFDVEVIFVGPGDEGYPDGDWLFDPESKNLTLWIPKGTPGEAAQAISVEVEFVEYNHPDYGNGHWEFDPGSGLLKLWIPKGPPGEAGPVVDSCCDPDLTHICGINWEHRGTIEINDFLEKRLSIVFDREVDPTDLHNYSFSLLKRIEVSGGLSCWCEVPSSVGPLIYDNVEVGVCPDPNEGTPESSNPNVKAALKEAGRWARGAWLQPNLDAWTPPSEDEVDSGAHENFYHGSYHLLVKGDFIRDQDGRAIDADHLPDWLPSRKSGDGIEGGTFESWFTVDGRNTILQPGGNATRYVDTSTGSGGYRNVDRLDVNSAAHRDLRAAVGEDMARQILAARKQGAFSSTTNFLSRLNIDAATWETLKEKLIVRRRSG